MSRRFKFRLPFKHSIFFKISLLMVISIFITITAVTFFGALLVRHYFPGDLHRAYEFSMAYVVDAWGVPPDRQKMQLLSEKYRLKLSYEGPDFRWSYDFPRLAVEPRFTAPQTSPYSFAFCQGHLLVRKEQAGHTFILAFPVLMRGQVGISYIVLLILMLTLVLVVFYFRIRKLLHPLRHLLSGVNHIQQGDFSYRIPVAQSDELGTLSDSFNRMTRLLKDMIKSKDQLLLDVSHELRSPLTRIKVALEFVKEINIKESIAADVEEMERMILELLETERMQSEYGKARFQHTDIILLLREVVKSYQSSSPQLVSRLPDYPVNLFLDEIRIRMLFKNLLENALRYSCTKAEGRPAASPLPVELDVTDEPEALTVRIRDHGTGIAEKDLPHVFEPFYRTDVSRSRETGGYGLGLYICKKIMEQHGGELSIQSREQEGTTVTVRFSKAVSGAQSAPGRL